MEEELQTASPPARRRVTTSLVALVALVAAGSIAAVAVLWDRSDDDGAVGEFVEDVALTTTTFPRVRPSPDELAALLELSRMDVSGLPDPPEHDVHSSHDLTSAPTTVPVDAATAELLAAQVQEAVDATAGLATARDATAQGYAFGSQFAPTVGTHYVRWSMVDQPFDPARPSMLLYDGEGPDAELVAFSYWVASPTAPEGFAGPNDVWHRHLRMCLVDGQPAGEGVTDPSQCPGGVLLDGRNLWMLHLWMVPGVENPWGQFAAVNPALR